MSIQIYTISISTDASVFTLASLSRNFDHLKLECPTFTIAGTTGTVMTVNGTYKPTGTLRPLMVVNPSSASTGPPLAANLGVGTMVGNFILDIAPAIGVPYLQIALTTAATGSMEVYIYGSRIY